MITLNSILKISIFGVALVAAAGLGQFALAQDTLLISYQGMLTDALGEPVTGSPAISFTIYTAGGVSKWAEGHSSVPVNDGLFSVILGSQTVLPDSVFNGDDRYLGISVEGDGEISPRTLLTSSPGAAVSRRVVGDIQTAPGRMFVKNSSGDTAVVMAADPGVHAMRLHPPDPCVPSDPCEPALEMLAEVDTHVLRIHPPDPCVPPEPCDPAFEIAAGPATNSLKLFSPDPCTSPPCTPAAIITAGPQGVDFDLKVSVPSDDEVTPISIRSDWSSDSSTGLLKIAAVAVAGQDYYEESPWIVEVNRDSTVMTFSRTDPTSGTNPKVKVVATSSASALTIRGEDPASDAQSIAMVAGVDGAKVGIGTGTPSEALEVVGTADVDGFKMATDAADGHVLTSDATGNGTWQAPSGGASKAACADMYEGMTNSSSQITITLPVTFDAPPYFSVTGLIKSGGQAGNMAHVVVSTLTTTSVTLTIQYWDGIIFDNIGDSVEMLLSYTAIEK